MERVCRDPAAPPQDALAEALVLQGILLCPETIGKYDLGPLLNYPEHRWLWQAMVRVHMRQPDLQYPEFYRAYVEQLKQSYPNDWQRLDTLLDAVYEDESSRALADYQRDLARNPHQAIALTDSYHSFRWWMQRLRDCAEARHGISAASEAAARYWRLDLEGARVAAAWMAPSRVIKVEV